MELHLNLYAFSTYNLNVFSVIWFHLLSFFGLYYTCNAKTVQNVTLTSHQKLYTFGYTCSGFLDSTTANRAYKKHYIWHFSQSTLYIGKNISREIVFRFFQKEFGSFVLYVLEQRIESQTATHCGNWYAFLM